MKKSNKANSRFFIASFLLLSTTCAVSQAAAQVISSLSRTVTIRIDSTGADTAYFAYPPALGYSSVRPDTAAINPPDAVWFDGDESFTWWQTAGDLEDSVRAYKKSINFDGSIIGNDSTYIFGTDSTYFSATDSVGARFSWHIQNTTQPRLGGIMVIFTTASTDTAVVSYNRFFNFQHTTSGIYDIRQR